MTDSNESRDNMNHHDLDRSALDRELDATLAKFAAVEPRAGLEERVMANLRAEQTHAADHSWWRWPAVAALAAVIVLALSVAWRSGKPVQNIVTQPRPAHADKHPGTQVATNSGPSSIQPDNAGSGRRLKPRVISYPQTAVAPAPKLDQFPSPQPLSEQERMLTEYVAEHHQQAVLIAQARMAELKKDLAEEMEEASATSNRQTSDQSVSQQENR
jgi:hypothetical protein